MLKYELQYNLTSNSQSTREVYDYKHTPGPWSFSRWGEFGDTRFYVAQQECASYTPNYSDVATLIAETVSSEQVEIQEANARLIAAAPVLLALAKMIVNANWTPEEEWPDIEDAAWAAVSKVEGEAS